MWGIIPAAGAGSRIQPLAFSKELLPVGNYIEDGEERPRAVSEYLVERPDETVAIGLPDTIWFPADALRQLPDDVLSFLLFPVEHPEFFDAVSTDDEGWVQRIHVKQRGVETNWIWGAFKTPGAVFHQLHNIWLRSERRDEYFGTLVNAWLAEGGRARGVRAGRNYVDTRTLHGYRAAIRLLEHPEAAGTEPEATVARPDTAGITSDSVSARG